MSLEAIRYKNGKLEILDQLLLPARTVYKSLSSIEEAADAITTMKVRGAPAIAIVGCLSLASCLSTSHVKFDKVESLEAFVSTSLDKLVDARPTAVNMSRAAQQIKKLFKALCSAGESVDGIRLKIIAKCKEMLKNDLTDNKNIGKFGADHIMENCGGGNDVIMLTHCNTGSLATSGFGTALGVIRELNSRGVLSRAYHTETRPYNQGSRLTAYELCHDNIPACLIADSMVCALMSQKKITAVVVGADRIASNGDVANKIGTHQIAVVAKHHGVPFYVAAPLTTHDPHVACGDDITIELRPPQELKSIAGVPVAPEEVDCWNPAFDVTPAHLITGGIITEKGVFQPGHSPV